MTLEEYFIQHPCVAVAFSGGVDSAYLLYAASRYGQRVKAYYVYSQFQPSFELEDARRLAQLLGCAIEVIPMDVLSVPAVAANPPDRCYYCKRALFSALCSRAKADGFSLLADGTNASDDAGDRPGMRALRELQVASPLRECGLTKPQIRRLSHEAGLFTWDKPAYACLATRAAAGQTLTASLLQAVERGEAALSALGFFDFRLRVAGGTAKLQVTEAQLPMALEKRQAVLAALSGLFETVTLDLKAREKSL